MEHPLSLVVTQPSAASQRAFAEEAAAQIPSSATFSATVGDNGLTILGLTELDLEIAAWELKKQFADLKLGRLTVRYRDGPPLLEPYYLATVDVPEESLLSVVSDLRTRRGRVESEAPGPVGKRVRVQLPVSECFGYYTVLRTLTQKRGEVSFEFLNYRPAGEYGA